MKKILGLDLGVSSIGWALVNEAENNNEKSSIIKLGVRVNPLTVDEKNCFETGKSITTNADRTLKRGMRRNLQRYKLRRNTLIDTMKSYGWIDDSTILAEYGKGTTFQTIKLRAKASEEKISLEELARVLLIINKKRGYKSSRKLDKSENIDEGSLIDSMETASILNKEGLTPGEYAFRLTSQGKYNLPDFYKSDLQLEFNRVWTFQQQFYPDILTDTLRDELAGKNEKQTWAICQKPFNISGIKRTTKGKDLLRENYEWRAKALKEKLDLEQFAIVLQKINSQLKNSDSYLGKISDRSKELFFNKQTVGQYQLDYLLHNHGASLKNQVFYRQDYIDEFNTIWDTQSKYHPELTQERKNTIRDIIIFYQRPLKSQKHLVSFCEFEKRRKVCPKSSPVFQEFKIWHNLNNLKIDGKYLPIEDKQLLFNELSIKKSLSKTEIIKLLFGKNGSHFINLKELEGNRTQQVLFNAYSRIIADSGHGEYDFTKMHKDEILELTSSVFSALGYNTDILTFDSSKYGKDLENQALFRLWHLIYSYTGDNSKSGNDALISKLHDNFGFTPEHAKIIANVTFEDDYGNLSTKAICRILPYMKEGSEYSTACLLAGYRHSARSLTKEEIDNKIYADKLQILPKNSLRNPVVEKILNQMVNVVNGIIDDFGKPDEIRIELARELKKSAQERQRLTDSISKVTKQNLEIEKILREEFGQTNITRNKIIRFKLYMELKDNGFHTLYSNTYVPREELFSKRFDIEHIIPQSRLFDDSFSNKTIESKDINIEKGNMTALDYISGKYGPEGLESYKNRIKKLLDNGSISQTKYNKLLMAQRDIPEDFIQRDLRDTQYISRKALEILETVVKSVVPTSGEITKRLREDWQLVDVMKELNWTKYNRLGLTQTIVDEDGHQIRRINDWTKRNDHRHHAMDALTIAFTKRCYIQYLNNLNARIPKNIDSGEYFDLSKYDSYSIPVEERSSVIRFIENSIISNGKFLPPMPLDEFRAEAKRYLKDILVSIKSKNKVITKNTNKSKCKGGYNTKIQLTPRGQLHNESVYGMILQYHTKEENVGSSFDANKISTVACEKYRNALFERLSEFGNNPKKAFCGSNSLEKNPLYTDSMHTDEVPSRIKTVTLTPVYTIRKQVSPDLNIDKVIDVQTKRILAKRLEEYGNDPRKAFSNIEENPIWLNKDKNIQIKRVTISGPTNVCALHEKHDFIGMPILDKNGYPVPSDFVSPSNNHHIAIYIDPDGNLQEQPVPFMEAVARACLGYPIIDKTYHSSEGWKFLFSMKQNEYFVFPNQETGFDPKEIDLTDKNNYKVISPNLFRVQKLTSKDYFFRHHQESNVDERKELKGITWQRIRNTNGLKDLVKVRVNHLGNIVQVGEC